MSQPLRASCGEGFTVHRRERERERERERREREEERERRSHTLINTEILKQVERQKAKKQTSVERTRKMRFDQNEKTAPRKTVTRTI